MAFEQDINVFVAEIGPETSKLLAAVAHETRANVENARATKPLTEWATDGQRGRRFEDVRPDGAIVLVWDYRSEIVQFAFEELAARSPVVSGEYRGNHFAQLDGVGLPPLTVPSERQLIGVERVTITNPLPYARRLETGSARQVDPHIFESAMIATRREYRGVAALSFGYIDLQSAYVAKTNRFRRQGSGDRGTGHAIRYPAIHIDLAA